MMHDARTSKNNLIYCTIENVHTYMHDARMLFSYEAAECLLEVDDDL
jgi:hypothetical protein